MPSNPVTIISGTQIILSVTGLLAAYTLLIIPTAVVARAIQATEERVTLALFCSGLITGVETLLLITVIVGTIPSPFF